jgi:hypothetical protein
MGFINGMKGAGVEEVKIHSGTRVKLKHISEDALPLDFVRKIKEFSHNDNRIQAVFVFAIEPEDQSEQPSMALAIKSSLFAKTDESFLQIVDEIQMLLPDDLAINLYRFGASDFLARYCVSKLDPIYLRTAAWLDKQRKKYG